MTTPETFTVRLLTQGGTPVGIGTLVSGRHILTCAHVVNTALGLGMYDQPKPAGTVTVDFPLLAKAPRTQARVTLQAGYGRVGSRRPPHEGRLAPSRQPHSSHRRQPHRQHDRPLPINAEVYRIAETCHMHTTVKPPQSGNPPR
jgi:hypothetical protein